MKHFIIKLQKNLKQIFVDIENYSYAALGLEHIWGVQLLNLSGYLTLLERS